MRTAQTVIFVAALAVASHAQYSPADWLTLADRPDVKPGRITADWTISYGIYRAAFGRESREGFGEGWSATIASLPVRVAYALPSGALEFAVAPRLTSVRVSWYNYTSEHGSIDDTWITAKVRPFCGRPFAVRTGFKVAGDDDVSAGNQTDLDFGVLGRMTTGSVEVGGTLSYRLRFGDGVRLPPIDGYPDDTLAVRVRWGNEIHGTASIDMAITDGYWLGGVVQGYVSGRDEPVDETHEVDAKRWRISTGPSFRFNAGGRAYAVRVLADLDGREDFAGVTIFFGAFAAPWPVVIHDVEASPDDLR